MTTVERVIELTKGTLQFDDKDIQPDTDLFQDLGVDSLDAVELMMAVEEEYGVKVPDDKLADLTTPAKIAAYVDANRG